ncbi:hypothetical protein [Rhodoplanes azumiensis]|uniref:Uncharacterized protein n=1 Tax=Rhodoplanes azumiensis TaxID=1897628 RepID=A0ABW5AHT3_9BRAD
MLSLAVNAALAVYGAIFLAGAHAFTPSDPYTQALGFAVAGHDRAAVRAVDQEACVFAVDDAVVHLGAIDRSRLGFALMTAQTGWGPIRHVAVTLHGDTPVYERVEKGLDEEGPWDDEAVRMLKRIVKARSPELFHDRRVIETDITLKLPTSDIERVRQDWATVMRGCAARKPLPVTPTTPATPREADAPAMSAAPARPTSPASPAAPSRIEPHTAAALSAWTIPPL